MPAEASPSAARFVVRPYRSGDETAILDLFQRSFHTARSLPHFDWEYRENPFGSRHISLAFDEASRLVAHYAAYVVPFVESGRALLAHQVGDTMTDPSVRHVGRGPTSVLGRTALHFYEQFCEGRIAFNFGFNVANIQKFSLRFLRSDRVEPVPYRRRDLVADPFPPLPRIQRMAQGYQMELVSRTDGEWDRLFARVAPDYGFLVRRDAAWVRWRYLEAPDTRYIVVAVRKWRVLAGWAVFKVRGDMLLWGDALFDPHWPEAPSVVLRQLCNQLPVRAVESWFPPRPAWFDSILEELRFRREPEPQDLSLMCVPFVLSDAVARMRARLYYTMGDGDLF